MAFHSRALAATFLLALTACQTSQPPTPPAKPVTSGAATAGSRMPVAVAPRAAPPGMAVRPGTSGVATPGGPAVRPPAVGALPARPARLPQPVLPKHLVPADWDEVPGWRDDDTDAALAAFRQSCAGLARRPGWSAPCAQIDALSPGEDPRAFFEARFTPFRVANADGSNRGLVTGYYEPLLAGSRKKTAKYRYPIRGVPADLITVDLGALYPELKHLRLRGRLDGNRLVPYYTRAEIEGNKVKGKALFWVEDPVELFFLHVQGSGRVRLENGDTVAVGYADQNGHPYKSIGKWLVEHGHMPLSQASMQGIKAWVKRHPEQLRELLNHNTSYVFFRELPAKPGQGPLGALGVPLTAGRSIAVDRRSIPLGAPVFLATTWPNSDKPLRRLMVAQDTGSAILGNVRADVFWGYGPEAGRLAGKMKQPGQMWVLLPKDAPGEAVLALRKP